MNEFMNHCLRNKVIIVLHLYLDIPTAFFPRAPPPLAAISNNQEDPNGIVIFLSLPLLLVYTKIISLILSFLLLPSFLILSYPPLPNDLQCTALKFTSYFNPDPRKQGQHILVGGMFLISSYFIFFRYPLGEKIS